MTMLIAWGWDDGLNIGTGGGTTIPTIQTAAARTGTRGLRCQTSGASQVSYQTITLPANVVTGILHVAFNTSSLWNGARIVGLYDGATLQAELRMRNDGKFDLYHGNTSTLLATGTFVYTVNTWVHLQLKWTIHDSTGLLELRINGASTADATFTGDVRNGGNAYVTAIWIGQQSSGVNSTSNPLYFDDFVVVDTNGSVNNNYLGDVGAFHLFATGAGTTQQWDLAGSAPAATAHASINEIPADDGVTYLETNVSGERFLLGWGDISSSATIHAVVTNIRAQKASASSREIKSTAKRTTTTLGAAHVLSTSWVTYQDVRELDTEGVAWTAANLNSSEFGADLTF